MACRERQRPRTSNAPDICPCTSTRSNTSESWSPPMDVLSSRNHRLSMSRSTGRAGQRLDGAQHVLAQQCGGPIGSRARAASSSGGARRRRPGRGRRRRTSGGPARRPSRAGPTGRSVPWPRRSAAIWPHRCRARPEGAGDDTGSGLPAGALQLPNDARMARCIGAAPPTGHGEHRCFFTVRALDVEDIGVPADATPAYLGFTMAGHTLARATLVATAETPAA
ncbi:hypothetical protein AB0K67_00460 [Nonomuraea sp. NPDC052634]|uniref:YbhB/YbcL family Raf kinase inhibitor-like protein n=1 Tax=Nonomuraea sp. NPDC052634 TaxID=3155813 RepID=UPI0034150E68